LQHVEGLLATTFADDDAVRPHAQSVLHQFTLANLSSAFSIGRTGLKSPHVELLQLQFRRILYGNQPLVSRAIGLQPLKHRGLATSGAAANDQRYPSADGRFQHIDNRRANGPDFDQTVHAERTFSELADRYQRAIDGNWLYGHVNARAVRQARINHRRGLV